MEKDTWKTPTEVKMPKLDHKGGDALGINSKSSISGKVRRRRTVFSRCHLDLLLKTFETNPYPGITLREKLSDLTGVHESRIQVWFQNRRARMNKKTMQEEENQPPMERPKLNHIPKIRQQALPQGKPHGVEHSNEFDSTYRNYAFSLHPLGYLHKNNLTGQQHSGYGWPNQHHSPVAAPPCHPNSSTVTAQQHYSYMQPHLSTSSNLPLTTTNFWETYGSEYALPPAMETLQELSLQDILEEFQPFWTDIASDCSSDNKLLFI